MYSVLRVLNPLVKKNSSSSLSHDKTEANNCFPAYDFVDLRLTNYLFPSPGGKELVTESTLTKGFAFVLIKQLTEFLVADHCKCLGSLSIFRTHIHANEHLLK